MPASVYLLIIIGFGAVIPVSAQDRISRQKLIVFSGTAFRTFPFGRVRRVIAETPVRIEGLEIVRRKHLLRKSVALRSTELCAEINGADVPIAEEDFLYRVGGYISYEFAGKIFAYEVDYEFFEKDTGWEIGAATSAFYVDARGNGTFGIRCVKDFRLDTVPEWIQRLSRQ